MRKLNKIMKKDIGSIGIGAMIVFIAMVLVAGIAASVLIQTSTKLEAQAMATGHDTTEEVSSGIAVFDILGYAADNDDISKIAIMVRARAGSEGVDLNETYIELSDSSKKVVMNYTSANYSKPDGQSDMFSAPVFPEGANAASQFGILVMEDADGSFVSANAVVMNSGDKIYLCINSTASYNKLAERTFIWGMVVPELGSPGVISFTTPASYSSANVFDLQ